MPRLGFKIDSRPAEDLPGLALLAESTGFDELWVCEDLGLAGGVAQAAAALAVTNRLQVGLGIAPAAVRNAMYLAMELSAVTRLSAGRFHAGIGHGVSDWLRQVGQHPSSLLTCLREVTEAVRALLEGGKVTYAGEYVQLDEVSLTHPPHSAPPLSLGVRGPRGLMLAKDLGVGVILAEGSTPEYVADTRRKLGPTAHITVFVWSNLDPDNAEQGTKALASTVTRALHNPRLAAQLGDLYQGQAHTESIRRLTVSGDAQTFRDSIELLRRSGADSIVFQPILGREEEQMGLVSQHILQP